jgi:hypothetical protein
MSLTRRSSMVVAMLRCANGSTSSPSRFRRSSGVRGMTPLQ